MAAAVIADTHAIIWYLSNSPKLSAKALSALEEGFNQGTGVGISAITMIEIIYLAEKGRVPAESITSLQGILDEPGSTLQLIPIDKSVVDALAKVPRDAVPDMPDRIIAATAVARRIPLVTCDAKIRSAGITAIW